MFRFCLFVGIFTLGLGMPALAWADGSIPVDQWYAYVCGDDGAVFKFLGHFLYPALTVVVAAALANSKTVLAIPVVGPLVNLVALNWVGWLRRAADKAQAGAGPVAAVMALVLLAGCAGAPAPISKPTGDAQADVQAWLGEVGADLTFFHAKAAKAAGGAVGAAVIAGRAACGAASELDGLYNAPLSQIGGAVVAVALGAGPDLAAADAVEAGIFKLQVQPACLALAGMDPNNPTADALTAAQMAIAAVPQLQAALTKAAPTVAAAIAAVPAPASPVVVPAASASGV